MLSCHEHVIRRSICVVRASQGGIGRWRIWVNSQCRSRGPLLHEMAGVRGPDGTAQGRQADEGKLSHKAETIVNGSR